MISFINRCVVHVIKGSIKSHMYVNTNDNKHTKNILALQHYLNLTSIHSIYNANLIMNSLDFIVQVLDP